MTNSSLDLILKKARIPERPDEFWDALPGRVRMRLGSVGLRHSEVESRLGTRLAWGLAMTACIAAAFVAGHDRERKESRDILESVKLVDEAQAMFPNRVRAIVQDEGGLRVVLSDRDDVPPSPPLYIRICDNAHCSSMVTFSGQEVQINGQKLTVLSDSHGGIILEGNHLLWSSAERLFAGNHLKIEALNLGAASL